MPIKSGLLLGVSCVAFIAAVGCVFELSSGTPTLGSMATNLILVCSVPLGVYSFVVAAREAKAHQER
ncbi:MAG TPA: hypothetical protein V6D19_16800 [Stenomitos sp.]